MRIVEWAPWSAADELAEDFPPQVTAWALCYNAFHYRTQMSDGQVVPLVPLKDDPKRVKAAIELMDAFDASAAQVPKQPKGVRRLRFDGARWGLTEDAFALLLEHVKAYKRIALGASDARNVLKLDSFLDRVAELEPKDYDKLMAEPYPPTAVA